MIDHNLKKEFITLLKSTERDGVDDVIEELQELGFFDAPASSSFHLNYDGGLVEHSLNVCRVALGIREQMIAMNKNMAEYLPEDSVIIASLLHDVCKADIYKKVTKKKKDKFGMIQTKQGFKLDYTNFPLGHGEKSNERLRDNGNTLAHGGVGLAVPERRHQGKPQQGAGHLSALRRNTNRRHPRFQHPGTQEH